MEEKEAQRSRQVEQWMDHLVEKIDKKGPPKTGLPANDNSRTLQTLTHYRKGSGGGVNLLEEEPKLPSVKGSPSTNSLRSQRKDEVTLPDMLAACDQSSKSSIAVFIGTEYVVSLGC